MCGRTKKGEYNPLLSFFPRMKFETEKVGNGVKKAFISAVENRRGRFTQRLAFFRPTEEKGEDEINYDSGLRSGGSLQGSPLEE